jgi:hypothetical protein
MSGEAIKEIIVKIKKKLIFNIYSLKIKIKM